jgi:hypothetical protein
MVGRALGEFREELMEQIEKMIAELNRQGASDGGESCCCRIRCREEGQGSHCQVG